MNDDRLEHALRRLDASNVAPEPPAAFGAIVRRVVAKRRWRNLSVGAAGVLALLVASSLYMFRPSAPQVASLDDELTAVRNELRVLDQQIAEQQAAQAQTEERLQRLLEPDPHFEMRIHVETVAALRFAEAEQSAAAGDNAHAQECYERVVALFPQSRSGVAAQERLAHLERN